MTSIGLPWCAIPFPPFPLAFRFQAVTCFSLTPFPRSYPSSLRAAKYKINFNDDFHENKVSWTLGALMYTEFDQVRVCGCLGCWDVSGDVGCASYALGRRETSASCVCGCVRVFRALMQVSHAPSPPPTLFPVLRIWATVRGRCCGCRTRWGGRSLS